MFSAEAVGSQVFISRDGTLLTTTQPTMLETAAAIATQINAGAELEARARTAVQAERDRCHKEAQRFLERGVWASDVLKAIATGGVE